MNRTMFISILFSLIVISCNGQRKENTTKKTEENQPKTNIQVNKEYDESGNLIKYDSTYSYYYSNIESDAQLRDSILNQFKSDFNNQYWFSRDPYFNNFFFQDSLMDFDFYTKDFFLNRFQNNAQRMNQLFMQMDSIKNLYFMEQFQEPPKKENVIL